MTKAVFLTEVSQKQRRLHHWKRMPARPAVPETAIPSAPRAAPAAIGICVGARPPEVDVPLAAVPEAEALEASLLRVPDAELATLESVLATPARVEAASVMLAMASVMDERTPPVAVAAMLEREPRAAEAEAWASKTEVRAASMMEDWAPMALVAAA